MRVAELGRLPRQHFLVADRRESFQPRVVVAPSFAPPAWNTIAPALRTAVQRGRAGVLRTELQRQVRELEERLLRDFEPASDDADDDASDAAATLPQRRPHARATKPRAPRDLPEFPDVVAGRAGRARRGGLP
mgnify:CR=1 FL=1